MTEKRLIQALLLASLAGNAVLLYQAANHAVPGGASIPPVSVRPVSANSETNAILNWSQIESPDYLVYVARLRAIGCPEETIRDLVTLDLQKVYQEKARSAERLPDGKARIERLDEEFRRSLASVLGPPAAEGLAAAPPSAETSLRDLRPAFSGHVNGPSYGRAVSGGFSAAPRSAVASAPESNAKPAPTTPAERPSPASDSHRGPELPADSVTQTPRESSVSQNPPTGQVSREYRELAEAARLHGVDLWKVDKAYSMMEEVRDRKLAILQNPNMGEEERSEELKRTHLQGREEIDRLIGPDTFRDYLAKTNRYSWLPVVPTR